MPPSSGSANLPSNEPPKMTNPISRELFREEARMLMVMLKELQGSTALIVGQLVIGLCTNVVDMWEENLFLKVLFKV